MKSIGALLLALGALLVATPPARGGWLSNLNPFASKKNSTDASDSTKGAESGSSKPLSSSLGSSRYNSNIASGSSERTTVQQLNGKPIHPVNSVAPAAPKGPSLLSRIGSAPGHLFAKTKSLFSRSKPAPAPKRMLGTPSGGSQFTHSGSIAIRQPTAASQFLSRPRPGY